MGEYSSRDDEASVRARVLSILSYTFLWLLANISTTILNKAVFTFAKFYFPITLSALHFGLQSVFTFLYIRIFRIAQAKELDQRGTSVIQSFSILFCLNIVIGNSGLRYVTVSFRQALQASIPVMVVPLSAIILQKNFSTRVKLCLAPTLCGVALAAYGEVEFHVIGSALTTLGCFFAALKAVLSNKFLTGNYKLHPLDLLSRIAPLAFLELIPFIIFMGEAKRLAVEWQFYMNFRDLSLILASAFAALALNYASFKFSQATSALTVCLAGNMRDVCTIGLSVLIFQNQISPVNALGICMAITGSALYGYMQYLEVKKVTLLAASKGKADMEDVPIDAGIMYKSGSSGHPFSKD
mmetsp:Transcript_1335/g.2532  ORF Transcript_1335/g.2532 Transcript_1335/m.2532 type:complete len:354 (-) Transcript_1335:561-1622(-)